MVRQESPLNQPAPRAPDSNSHRNQAKISAVSNRRSGACNVLDTDRWFNGRSRIVALLPHVTFKKDSVSAVVILVDEIQITIAKPR